VRRYWSAAAGAAAAGARAAQPGRSWPGGCGAVRRALGACAAPGGWKAGIVESDDAAGYLYKLLLGKCSLGRCSLGQ
jgi:hypothetical protein